MKFRPVSRPDDVARLDSLFELAERADGHRPIGEHKYLDLLHADPEIVTGLVAEIEGDIVAYVAIVRRDDFTWNLELAVHPLHRHPALLRDSIAAGVNRVIEGGGRLVRVWAYQPNVVAALLDSGFGIERELLQLVKSLENLERGKLPPGIELHPFRRGLDEEAWIETNNAAFAEHPENGAWSLPLFEDRARQPWFDPGGFQLAWQGQELAGFCWTKVHDEQTGEIYVIAVHPQRQGSGLGKSLVQAGLDHLYRRGCRQAILYVDRGNHPAVALYDRLGFRLDHIDRSFVKDLSVRVRIA